MSETYEFKPARPIQRAARKGAGRKPAPNPFIDAVRGVAGAVNADGAPEARTSVVTLDAEHGETRKTRHSRIRRQLTAAGKLIAEERGAGEPYSIHMDLSPREEGAAEYILTFWDRDAGK